MYSCRKAAFALVSLIILVTASAALMPFVSRGQVKPLKHHPRRSFYLTQTGYNGSQALTACAEGYHMASFREIRDTSNLSYDTQLGFTQDDFGLGPPGGFAGWIRTGYDANEVPQLVSVTPGLDERRQHGFWNQCSTSFNLEFGQRDSNSAVGGFCFSVRLQRPCLVRAGLRVPA